MPMKRTSSPRINHIGCLRVHLTVVIKVESLPDGAQGEHEKRKEQKRNRDRPQAHQVPYGRTGVD